MLVMAMNSCKESEEFVMPESLLPEMTIGTISIANDIDWTLTRTNKYVALSNYEEKTQYYLTWEGGITSGKKSDGKMRVSTNGSQPVDSGLTEVEVVNDGVNCKVHFVTEGNKEGTFIFPL